MNITEYIARADRTFSEEPFNPVDSLVLSQLSYAGLEIVIDELGKDRVKPGMTIRDFLRNEYFEKVFADDITDEENLKFFLFAAASRRFRDLTVKNVVSELDEKQQKQFAAFSFEIYDDTDYIAFRGTDGTLFGWKEDFNMAFMPEVPSQARAVKYIEEFYGRTSWHGRKKKLIIGGHSKGGNIAVYGAAMCDSEIHPRILEVFSHDGPGFRDDVMERIKTVVEKDSIKVTKEVPQTSIIGMLLETQEDYVVVQSDAVGIMQHAAYSWQVEGSDFVYKDDISQSGEYYDRTLHEWVESSTYEEREVFVNTLYDIFVKNDINSLHDMKALTPKKLIDIYSTLNTMDDKTKNVFSSMLKSLANIAIKSIGRNKPDTENDKAIPV